jgi:hypothetical protein
MATRVLPLGSIVLVLIRLELRHVLHHFRARAARSRHVQWCVSKRMFAARNQLRPVGPHTSRGVGVPDMPHVATCRVRLRNHIICVMIISVVAICLMVVRAACGVFF